MKTILIANQKGGCGKTLVVDELAFSFDRTDVKYSLYDLDGQGGIIYEPKVIDDADYAIVDTPGYISDNLGELIQGADLIIIPTRTTYKDIPTLQTMLELIEQNGKSSDTMFIFNAWNRFNAAAAFEDWFKTVRDGRHVSIIPQSEEFAKAGMYGKSVVEYSPRSKKLNDYSYIHQRIINIEKWKFEAFEGLVYPSSQSNYELVKEMMSQSEVYVFEVDKMIQGFVGLNDEYIEGIFVSDEMQSCGIGKLLLDYIKDKKVRLQLNVYQKNARAISFYQREGFIIRCEGLDEATGEKEYTMLWKQK